MLHEVDKVHSVHSRVGTFGDYLFDGFKHCSFVHIKEVVMRINNTVLNGFVTGTVDMAGYLLYQKAGHALANIPISYKFMVLWMSYVCIVTRQFTDAAGGLNVEGGTADATGSVLATELSGVAGKMDFT